jgi:hypothetical protein
MIFQFHWLFFLNHFCFETSLVNSFFPLVIWSFRIRRRDSNFVIWWYCWCCSRFLPSHDEWVVDRTWQLNKFHSSISSWHTTGFMSDRFNMPRHEKKIKTFFKNYLKKKKCKLFFFLFKLSWLHGELERWEFVMLM